ncbi:MAG: hypothetical protein RTU63_07785 [Candidatus Thorarchaeota archaeon]
MEDIQERFEEFLRTYRDENDNLVYWELIKRMIVQDEFALSVDFNDLVAFDNRFSMIAHDYAYAFLELLSSGLLSVLRLYDPVYANIIDKTKIKVRVIDYHEFVPINKIRSKHIGKLIQISGDIIEVGDIKSVLVQGYFNCNICSQEIIQDQYRTEERYVGSNKYPVYLEPKICPVCSKKTPVRLIHEKSKFTDWQKVSVQEDPYFVPEGRNLRSIDVILEGDIVDTFAPGDYARVTGILFPAPDVSPKQGKLTTFGAYIHANGVVRQINDSEELEPSELEQIALRVYNQNLGNSFFEACRNIQSPEVGFSIIGRKFEFGRYTFEEGISHNMVVKLDGKQLGYVVDGAYHSVPE